MARTKPQPKKRHRVTEHEFNRVKAMQNLDFKPVQVLLNTDLKRSSVQKIFNTATWEDWQLQHRSAVPSRPIEKLTRAQVEAMAPKIAQQEIKFIPGPDPVKPKDKTLTDAAWATVGALIRIEKLLQRLVSQNEDRTGGTPIPVVVEAPTRRRGIFGSRKQRG